jgi:hypothetical protein
MKARAAYAGGGASLLAGADTLLEFLGTHRGT